MYRLKCKINLKILLRFLDLNSNFFSQIWKKKNYIVGLLLAASIQIKSFMKIANYQKLSDTSFKQ